jgi:hypothetical protein
MSAKFYNGRRSLGDLIRNLIQSGLSLPEFRALLVSHIDVGEIVVEPALHKRWRPELMSRDKVMIAAGNNTFVDPAPLDINLPVIEKVLNHSPGSFAGIVGVYQRHNSSHEKRRALDRWGKRVADLTSGIYSQNVFRLETWS